MMIFSSPSVFYLLSMFIFSFLLIISSPSTLRANFAAGDRCSQSTRSEPESSPCTWHCAVRRHLLPSRRGWWRGDLRKKVRSACLQSLLICEAQAQFLRFQHDTLDWRFCVTVSDWKNCCVWTELLATLWFFCEGSDTWVQFTMLTHIIWFHAMHTEWTRDKGAEQKAPELRQKLDLDIPRQIKSNYKSN